MELQNDLSLGTSQTSSECKWKTVYDNVSCPDPDINYYYYSGLNDDEKIKINLLEKNFLQETSWDPHKHNLVYIHGYGGGGGGGGGDTDEVFPTSIIKNAYINNGSYNLFIVDWSPLSKPPCYLSSVYNLNKVSKCTAELYKMIRSMGISSNGITCVGHSLGAHGCGLISKHIDFRMHRIIGLDPAGPMITSMTRLKSEMANDVQVIYTNAGKFGDIFTDGKVNFCINGGKIQPKCRNSDIGMDLCSHMASVCYLAESVDGTIARVAKPCARQCPFGPRKSQGPIKAVIMGNSFPDDFFFGFATASYQIEGGWKDDGKGENIWDRLVHNDNEKIKDGSTGDIACDSYHLYKEDVQLLKNLNADVYRFSLSWSRILPNGDLSKINQPGIIYYKNLLNELINNNIKPMVTLYHWDLPQPLQNLGGWTNPIIVDYFEDYSKLAFQEFGNMVNWWITFNEPFEICKNGYGENSNAPALNMSGKADYLCAHNILKSHARAFHVYDEIFAKSQKGQVGITLNGGWNEPLTDSEEDKMAAETALEFSIGWFLHPILGPGGDYPKIMRENIDKNSKKENLPRSRLPNFDNFWKIHIQGTLHFLGVNHYSTYLTTPSNEIYPVPSYMNDLGVSFSQNSSWPPSSASWLKVEPIGFRKKLNWIKNYTRNFPIIITENGYADDGKLCDTERINYHSKYLNELSKSILIDECNVMGYVAWSLFDNFEWNDGYSLKFGIYNVNFTHPNRIRKAKSSVEFFKKLINNHTIEPLLN
ncbi:beta-glucosidase, putative [Pediculus humanus corporis]|uniref:Beta-glucosidase, putative n=1 Tax=Pediculus humanus subsp. corporis TaxID=121224 RepID=E0VJB5_PEDHC|nr:beta-glucosidase, putative [Pediculus humanus corporis]EEB13471.1 beta-glucosidase, putative [Pediculus humanus corporis]